MKRKNREEFDDDVDDEPCSKKQRCHYSSPLHKRYEVPGAELLLRKSLEMFVELRFNKTHDDNDKCMDLETFGMIYRERIENVDKSLAGLRLDSMNIGKLMIDAVEFVFGDDCVKEYENEKRVELKIHYKSHGFDVYSYLNDNDIRESQLSNNINGSQSDMINSPVFGNVSPAQSNPFDETTPISNKSYNCKDNICNNRDSNNNKAVNINANHSSPGHHSNYNTNFNN